MKKIFSPEVEELIASLRAMPRPDHNRRDLGTKEFGSLVEACVEKYHIGRLTPEETVMENWERIVGGPFSKRCRPERITPSGSLLVQVPNPTVRRELQFHEDRMLTVLCSLSGCSHIRRIIFKSGG